MATVTRCTRLYLNAHKFGLYEYLAGGRTRCTKPVGLYARTFSAVLRRKEYRLYLKRTRGGCIRTRGEVHSLLASRASIHIKTHAQGEPPSHDAVFPGWPYFESRLRLLEAFQLVRKTKTLRKVGRNMATPDSRTSNITAWAND